MGSLRHCLCENFEKYRQRVCGCVHVCRLEDDLIFFIGLEDWNEGRRMVVVKSLVCVFVTSRL